MIMMGLFRKSDRLMLLHGLLVKKMTMGPRHFGACRRIAKALAGALPAGWHERQDSPVTLTGGPAGFGSEPEPDVVVVSGAPEDYEDVRHPGPDEIALLVQVAATSLGCAVGVRFRDQVPGFPPKNPGNSWWKPRKSRCSEKT